MPDIPAEAEAFESPLGEPFTVEGVVKAAEAAIREGVRIRLGENALAEACEGRPIVLSGTEAQEAARLAVEAVAPMLLAQGRAEGRAQVAAEMRALADYILAIPDEGLNTGQWSHRDDQAAFWRDLADKTERGGRDG